MLKKDRHNMNSNQDFIAMKKLLTSWNVEMLFGLFKEEDISMAELKMMKFRHVSHLLKNYKMGVKIRFEYNLENWRNEIGKPLQTDQHTQSICCHCKKMSEGNEHTAESNQPNKILIENKYTNGSNMQTEVPTDHLELEYLDPPPPPISPQSTKSDHVIQMPNLTPIPMLRTAAQLQNRSTENGEMLQKDNISPLSDLLTNSFAESTTDESTPKFPSKNTPDRCPVTLTQILQLSGTRGMGLLKYYEENKHLTNTHRIQLIQLIVDFFDDNDYHLSLNMSHNLEWQILKMFPTEKLQCYRTEKRGKIYVKFSNMKRYKRERNNKVKPDMEKFYDRSYHDNIDGPLIMTTVPETNMDTTSYDTWPEGAEAEIEVKAEQLSD